MILLLDNYDSFTYNLLQYVEQLGSSVQVHRNDALSVSAIEALQPQAIIISPGPGRPEAAGICLELIQHFSGKVPILGVCLGHQAIAVAFGAVVGYAQKLMHGKTSMVTADGRTIYNGITKPFQAMRYHSLAVERASLPDCIEISCETADGEIMGIRHREHLTEGIQFHPESIMTPIGKRLLRNFMRLSSENRPGKLGHACD